MTCEMAAFVPSRESKGPEEREETDPVRGRRGKNGVLGLTTTRRRLEDAALDSGVGESLFDFLCRVSTKFDFIERPTRVRIERSFD